MRRRYIGLYLISFMFAGVLSAGFNFSNMNSAFKVSGGTFNVNTNVSSWDGTLKKGSSGTIAGSSTIGFSEGIFDKNGVKSLMTADYVPDTGLALGNSERIDAAPGQMLDAITVNSAVDSAARIEGQPTFNSAITISAGKELELAIQSKLNQNIQFASNSAKLTLQDDLKLADAKKPVTSGDATEFIIDVNHHSFIFGCGGGGDPLTISHVTRWYNADDIVLTGSTVLESTWGFTQDSIIQGHGNVFDISHASAELSIEAGQTLQLQDMVLKGLQDSRIVFGDATSRLYLSNVEIVMFDDLSMSSGLVHAGGPVRVYTQDKTWHFSDDAKLTLDGPTLWMDEGSAANGDMTFAGTSNYAYSNSATIKAYAVDVEDLVYSNSVAINAHAASIATNISNISNNAGSISTNEGNISDNAGAISTNADNIGINVSDIGTLNTLVTNTMNAVYSDLETYSAAMETWVGSIETDLDFTVTMNQVYSDLETYSASMETWVGGIETDVATNVSDISTVNTLITNTMNAVYSDIETYSASMETWVSGIETDVATNADDITTVNTLVTNTMNAVYSDIETYSASMETWVGGIETDLSTLDTLVTNTMNAVYSDIETYSASMETWVSGIETDVATNADDITTVNTLITNTMNAVYSDIETYSASMETWVSDIETDVATNVSDISTVNTLITNTMNAVYSDVETYSASMETWVSGIETDVSTLDTLVTNTMNAVYSDIETYSASMETWVGGIETDLSTLDTLVTNTMNAVYSDIETYSASMETWVSGIETDVATNADDITTVNTLVTNTMNAVYSDIETYSASMESWVGDTETDVATNVSNISTNLSSINIHTSHLNTLDRSSGDISFDSSPTLTFNYYLGTRHKMNITEDATLDGDGYYIQLAGEGTDLLSVAAAKDFVLQNVLVKDFDPTRISVGSGGSITLADAVELQLGNNIKLDSTLTLTIDGGRVSLNAMGHEIDFDSVHRGMDVVSGSTLQISNARIKGLTGNNLRCVNGDATITFSSCELLMAGNYSFTEGYIDLYDKTAIQGAGHVFAYQSPKPLTVKADSQLYVDRNVTFSYDSDSATKTKLVLDDATSELYLNSCTLHVTATGLQISNGRLVIENKVTGYSEASSSAEAIILKSDLDVDVLSGGIFDLTAGIIEYED